MIFITRGFNAWTGFVPNRTQIYQHKQGGVRNTPREDDSNSSCKTVLCYFSFDVEWEEYQQEQQSDKPQDDKKSHDESRLALHALVQY